MTSTFFSYQLITGNTAKPAERKASDAQAISEIGYFRSHIKDVKSLDDFLADSRLVAFAVKAYGLDDAERAKALLQQAKTDGVESALKTIPKMSEAGYRDLVRTFDFKTFGEATTLRWEVSDDTVTAYAGRTLAVDPGMQKSLDRESAKADVKHETDYYRAHIGEVKSIDDFLANTRLFTYAMKAYGLEDMSYAKAFMKRALTEGIDDSNSFANRLQDDRYRDFVRAFDFKTYGASATDRWEVTQGTVDAYVRESLEMDAGEEDEGVRLALYFRRKAPEVSSAMGLLADKALGQVVRTALGLPDEAAQGSIDAQAAVINRKMNIADLKDPDKLDAFIRRFTALWDVRSDATPAPILTLYNPQVQDFDTDLLLKLQNLRSGVH